MSITALSAAAKILDEIDARVSEEHLLKHPFYRAWTAGTLSSASLRNYAAQYYLHVAAFPTYLSAVHAQTDDPGVRRHILNNLIEEEVGSPNHPELWMQFAESLGWTRAEIEQTEPWPETVSLVGRFRKACREHGTAAGLAALYAYESQVPVVSESKIQGLKQFYGFGNPRDYRYFSVHIEADQEHARIERQLLLETLTPFNRDAALHAVGEILDCLWKLLSAVGARHAIS